MVSVSETRLKTCTLVYARATPVSALIATPTIRPSSAGVRVVGSARGAWTRVAPAPKKILVAARVAADFAPLVCHRDKLAVWFAFWGEVKSRPTYRKICDEYDRYYDSVVEKLCAGIIEEGGYTNITAAAAAEALTCMTNGLWLSCLISPKDFDRDIAWGAIMSYLANVFPKHYETT